jgi:hypothetical protein
MEQTKNMDSQVAFEKPKPFLRWVWLPLFVALGGLAMMFQVSETWPPRWMSNVGLFLFVGSALYFLVQMIGRFCLRQWRAGFWALARLAVCLIAFVAVAIITLFASMFGPSEDNFAGGLTIPPDLEVVTPLEAPQAKPTTEDAFQNAMLAALKTAPGTDSSITPAFPSLRILARNHRPLLLRYLASHPGWRVFEENGALCATRRWQKGGMWLWDLHGYYSKSDFDRWGEDKIPEFQSRTTIGLNGKTWAQNSRGASFLEEGTTAQNVTLGKGNGLDQSYCVVRCEGMVVELFEQSAGAERRLSKEALKTMESEFKALVEKKTWSHELLPASSIRTGKPVINLYNGFQPGIYDTESWVNPGEPGTVYLRAYEVTRKTRLSEGRLYESSNERVGWSENPEELFLYNTHITIYEGDWGQPYAARFELWFKPESGAAERKLIERNFKIEGWQR